MNSKKNAKEELLNCIKLEDIKCAIITKLNGFRFDDDYDYHYDDIDNDELEEFNKIKLNVNYTNEELEDFLHSLDFNYDNGFGSQELGGIVWLKNDSWLSRGEYDGSEWWQLNMLPDIPEEIR